MKTSLWVVYNGEGEVGVLLEGHRADDSEGRILQGMTAHQIVREKFPQVTWDGVNWVTNGFSRTGAKVNICIPRDNIPNTGANVDVTLQQRKDM